MVGFAHSKAIQGPPLGHVPLEKGGLWLGPSPAPAGELGSGARHGAVASNQAGAGTNHRTATAPALGDPGPLAGRSSRGLRLPPPGLRVQRRDRAHGLARHRCPVNACSHPRTRRYRRRRPPAPGRACGAESPEWIVGFLQSYTGGKIPAATARIHPSHVYFLDGFTRGPARLLVRGSMPRRA